MKYKHIGVIAGCVGLVVSAQGAFAQSQGDVRVTNTRAEDAKVEAGTKGDVRVLPTTANTEAQARVVQNEEREERRSENASEKVSTEDRGMGDVHRSRVATFVQNLLNVSDREAGIGEEVRKIAQAQNDTRETVAQALDKVERTKGLRSFFLGTDYKSVGALRSQMVTTDNHLAQLKKLIEKATNAEDKVTLQAQIDLLEKQKIEVNTFISAHENKFSLFGWLFKSR